MPKKSRKSAKKAPVTTRRWSKMHVRSLLYKHYKSRYKDWKDTKADADAAIHELKAKGYKRASKKAVLEVVKGRRVAEIEKKRESNRPKEPVEYFFRNHPDLLEPFPFYEAQNYCVAWEGLSKKVMVASKFVWTTGEAFRGGEIIPYDRTFRSYANALEKLQSQQRKSGEYETEWFFKLLIDKAEWDEELQAYIVLMITSDSAGRKQNYFGEEEGEELPPVTEAEPEKKPEIIPQPEIPEAKPVPGELTPEQRMHVEIEKERVIAKEKYESEARVKIAEQYSNLFASGKLTFDQYERLMGKLFL